MITIGVTEDRATSFAVTLTLTFGPKRPKPPGLPVPGSPPGTSLFWETRDGIPFVNRRQGNGSC
jgi:hypothetical protein